MVINHLLIDQAYQQARKGQLNELLPKLTFWVTGKGGSGLACNGFALHTENDPPVILDQSGRIVDLSDLEELTQDRVMVNLGLKVVRVNGDSHKTGNALALVSAIVRLGLVSRILDMSYEHLNQRKSFGQKTTRHQLIKASFSDIFGDITQLKQQLNYRVSVNDFEGLECVHENLTRLLNQAEKLMGGHGFMLGSTHTISYLAMLLYSLFGKQEMVAV
ncbi:acyl-CoA dehydrogenase family protein [Vibrio splendidus]